MTVLQTPEIVQISYSGSDNDKESESPSKVWSFISHTKQNILQMSEQYKYSQLMLSTTSLVKCVHMYIFSNHYKKL